jgi:hypothetical protein
MRKPSEEIQTVIDTEAFFTYAGFLFFLRSILPKIVQLETEMERLQDVDLAHYHLKKEVEILREMYKKQTGWDDFELDEALAGGE